MQPGPSFADIFPYRTHSGAIHYRDNDYQYIFCRNGHSLSLFVFDPQTDGMSLTNACDFILEMIAKELVSLNIISPSEVNDLFTVGDIALRDSYGQWSKVKTTLTTARSIRNLFVVTGVHVSKWQHFNFTKEYLELFKILG
jgi:hypothetical protein